ncbi:hypothetical protein [Arthrobacter sp. PsM3]|nr:hypothetical protein [Arthrobacter sp. PsM3]MDN4644722.1 hypothetical protein [Arthrobacter sp. PsM3]
MMVLLAMLVMTAVIVVIRTLIVLWTVRRTRRRNDGTGPRPSP